MALHKKYGHIVWIAPNEISVSDTNLRNVIYGFQNYKKDLTFFKKSRSYEIVSANQDFSFVFEQNSGNARLGKYHMWHFYSEQGLLDLEENFDKVPPPLPLLFQFVMNFCIDCGGKAVEELIEGLDKHHVKTGTPCKMVDWTEFFALDIFAQVTADQSAGFCLAGKDVDNAASGTGVIFRTIGVLMQLQWALSVTSRAIRGNIFLKALITLYRNVLLLPTFTFETGTVGVMIILGSRMTADS